MAEYTSNFNLKKPAPDDFVDVADLNGNFDTIDEELKKAQDGSKQYYGVCSTSGATAAKIVTVEGDFVLETGAAVDVRFNSANTASSPTLNVNGTGAKAIKKYGTTAPNTYMWYGNSIVRLIYNGSYWIMQNSTTATTTYYGITKLSNSTSSASQTEAATPYAVKTVMDKANASYEQAARNKVWQGTCETINEAIKEVNVGEGFELYNGVKIRVYFESNTVSTGTLSLNVNGTGAFEIVTVEGMTLHPRFIQGGDYLNFTYTETSWGSATEPYNVWMIDNVTIAGINNFGVVRVKNSPNANQDGKDGFAVSPKALQAVKDIADAALPKSGGIITGSLEVTGNQEGGAGEFIVQEYGGNGSGNYVTAYANESTSLLDVESVNGASATIETSDNAEINLQGQKAYINLHANDAFSQSLAIWCTASRRYVRGLTTPTIGSEAANKEYVDSRFPGGSIILFYTKDMSGQTIPIPEGFTLCDGNNNTPNLTALAPADCVYILREQ